jgi:NAD(P)-dependent dehydrogenase (short-subunit alcohol dehydrogenase family)
MSVPKVSVVTGANKGIGYAICKSLYQQEDFPLHIILTARDTGSNFFWVLLLKITTNNLEQKEE